MNERMEWIKFEVSKQNKKNGETVSKRSTQKKSCQVELLVILVAISYQVVQTSTSLYYQLPSCSCQHSLFNILLTSPMSDRVSEDRQLFDLVYRNKFSAALEFLNSCSEEVSLSLSLSLSFSLPFVSIHLYSNSLLLLLPLLLLLLLLLFPLLSSFLSLLLSLFRKF
jgi:hypothetical protein